MTSVRGVVVLAAPCCGRRYAAPHYRTMNFMAAEHWTDGWRDGALLMPNDSGLRRCDCGWYLRMRDLVDVATEPASELPAISHVQPEQLDECVEQCAGQKDREGVEEAARIELWWHLNHPYRERYRAHRDREDAAHDVWQEVDVHHEAPPDTRSWWQKLLRFKAPGGRVYRVTRRRPYAPFTMPEFAPGDRAEANLRRLGVLLRNGAAGNPGRATQLAEVYRELGMFEEASAVMPVPEPAFDAVVWRLVGELIAEQRRGPVRYRV